MIFSDKHTFEQLSEVSVPLCTWVTYLSVAATARIHFHKKSPSSGNLPFLASKNAHTCETLYCTAMSRSWVRHSHISKGVLHSAPIDPQRNLLWKGRGYRPQPPETLNQIDLSFSKEDQLKGCDICFFAYIDLNDCQFFRIMEWLMFFFSGHHWHQWFSNGFASVV